MHYAVITEFVFLAANVACSLSLEEALPVELQAWTVSQAGTFSAPHIAYYVVCILALLVGMIGLLTLKRWSRWVYLVSTIAAYLPLYGPTVEHGVTASLEGIATLISGMIIGLSFFTDALDVPVKLPDSVRSVSQQPTPDAD